MTKARLKSRYVVMGLKDSGSGGVDFWEYHNISIRNSKGVLYAYWLPKLPGTTWVKLSTKHGDWGWCPTQRGSFRVRTRVGEPPYSASKRGALRVAIAETKAYIREWGDSWGDDPLLQSDPAPSVHLLKYERALSRTFKK